MVDAGHQPYVFISYASADRERVLLLVDRLEAAGVRVWIDREGIRGGANYAEAISEALKGAAALILMASSASLSSRNVKQELALGWRFEKTYLPLLLETVAIPDDLAYWLEGSQWVEILLRDASEWLGDVAHALHPLGIRMQLPEASTPASIAVRARPLLVGREREQAVLRQHLDQMLAGQGSVVLVGGEAGMGKTTLVEDLSVQAEEAGALVLWGHAYDLSVTPPYGPWLELWRQYRRLGGSLPPLPPFIFDLEALAKVGSQETFFVAVADFLRSVAVQRPLLLVLDDLHWADQASLDFFRSLARQVGEQPLLLLATYRTDELTRRHPLYSLLPLVVREAGAIRLEVRPLDVQGARALIEQHYTLAPADRVRLEHFLAERAEGNPLFAGEILKTLEEDGVLAPDDHGWVLGDLALVTVPLLLMQVIEVRLTRLSEETRSLLQLAAVIGQEVPVDLWQQVSGGSDEALIAAIEEGQGAQLLAEEASGRSYRFRHALLREALYQEVVTLRRRLWHRQLGEALAAAPSPDPDMVAYHFQQAGDARAPEWLLKAGERAQATYSWVTAAERFEAALASMAEQGAPAVDRTLVAFHIAMLTRYVDVPRALRLMREAQRLAEEARQGGLAAICRFEAGMLQCFGGDIRDGLAVMEAEAIPIAQLSQAERDVLAATFQKPEIAAASGLVYGTVVLNRAMVGPLQKAVAMGEQHIATAPAPESRAGQGSSTFADGWLGLARAYAQLGKPQAAQQAFSRAQAVYQAIEHHALVAQTYQLELELLQLPYFADQPEEQLRYLAAEGMGAVRKASEANPTGLPAQWIALPLLLLRGDWDQAHAVAASTYEIERESRRPVAAAVLAQLAWAEGDAALASRVISDVFPAGPSTEPGNTTLFEGLSLQRLAVQLGLDTRDLPSAHAWLEAHDWWLDWSGAVLGRAEGTLLWAQYHHANGDSTQARAAAEQALTHASDPRQPLALIAVHRFLGQLDTEAGAVGSAAEHLSDSLRLTEACAAPFERALTLLELARLQMAQNKMDEMQRLLDEVQAICEPLGVQPTLDRAATLRTRLTP